MTTTFDLNKEKQTVQFILQKHGVPNIRAEVVAILDVSGSTRHLYKDGTMQEALQRVIPVALNLDDNGDLPVYTFNDGENFDKVDTDLTPDNYANYVARHIYGSNSLRLWGSTDYSFVLHRAVEDLGFIKDNTRNVPNKSNPGFFRKLLGGVMEHYEEIRTTSTSGLPAIIYFFTDGANERDDKVRTKALLHALADAKSNMYFNFIGVGTDDFSFLAEIGDLYPNTGFAQITDIAATAGTDKIYEYLVPEELTGWLKAGATVQTR